MYPDPFNYKRLFSSEVKIGTLHMGGVHPVRVQTMANTDTNDIEKSVEQCRRVIEAGGELMRYTTQGIREVESLNKIHRILRAEGCSIPLAADIHFNAGAAMLAARYVEKVRINPGNFITGIKRKEDSTDYTEEEYQQEYKLLEERFADLLNVCRKHHTAIRIGVNHGSLGRRIVSRYGDTSQGMVESCMELLRICRSENFGNVVISMKTSNTVFMVHTVRQLVKTMRQEGFSFPLHLGVTEAGDGEDGRIKSAAGIGALLSDGIGDTIRISLSEDPEFEIPAAKTLVSYIDERTGHEPVAGAEHLAHNPYEYERRETHAVGNIGGGNVPVVIALGGGKSTIQPDYTIEGKQIYDNSGNAYPVYGVEDAPKPADKETGIFFLRLKYTDVNSDILRLMCASRSMVVLLDTSHKNGVGEQRAFFHLLLNAGCTVPVVITRSYSENDRSHLQIKSAADIGVMFIDGFGDGILLQNKGNIESAAVSSIAFGILQAVRVRMTKTEYISCPGCGRTLFNLQQSIAQVKEKTSHLKGLKIAVMGCIVNGPGEMADADYGYVGAGRGKVSLYRKKECIERNIPEEEAVDKLLELILSDKK